MVSVKLIVNDLYGYFLLSLIFAFNSAVPQQERCSNLEFKCIGVEQCVSKEFLCDGMLDCSDGSDETTDLCEFRSCSRPLDFVGEVEDLFGIIAANHFRCNYGGCIPWQFRCDGTKTCFDGSDESVETCGSQKCRRGKFRCDYGACINSVHRCNGKVDCFDGSDETEELCSTLRSTCRRNYFRCNYGACIYWRKKCNGKIDCADQSDEAPELCGYQKKDTSTSTTTTTTMRLTTISTTTPTTTTPTTTAPTTTPTTTTPTTTAPTTTTPKTTTPTTTTPKPTIAFTFKTRETTPTSNDKNSSVVFTTSAVTIPSNFTLLPPTESPALEQPCPKGECLCPPPLRICVSCPPGTNIGRICEAIVNERRLCSTESVNNVHLEILSCGSVYPFLQVDADQVRVQSELCGSESGVPPSTLALVDCWGKFSELLTCQSDGRWYPQGETHSFTAMDRICQPSQINSNVCGRLPSARRGDKTKFAWPFLVSLLDYGEFFCSGTLIASQWVLTTASCVVGFQEQWDETGILELTVQMPNGAKELNVSAIYTHPLHDIELPFQNDLTLLKLETSVTLNEQLIPACLMQAYEDISGLIAATLIREENEKSHWKLITQTLDMECFDPQHNCSSELEDDQFCGKTVNLYNLNYGVPGSPYLINGGTESNERWTVAGVYSYLLQTTGCSSRPVFVSVHKHWGWIRRCIQEEECSFLEG